MIKYKTEMVGDENYPVYPIAPTKIFHLMIQPKYLVNLRPPRWVKHDILLVVAVVTERPQFDVVTPSTHYVVAAERGGLSWKFYHLTNRSEKLCSEYFSDDGINNCVW